MRPDTSRRHAWTAAYGFLSGIMRGAAERTQPARNSMRRRCPIKPPGRSRQIARARRPPTIGHYTRLLRPSSRIIAAPFSALIIVGALEELPDEIVGMIEASTTRRRSSPMTRRRSSTTAYGIALPSHLGGPDGVKDRGADVARSLDQGGVIIANGLPREIFDRMVLGEGGLLYDVAGDADRIDSDAAILVGREIVRLDDRLVGGVRRAQPHKADEPVMFAPSIVVCSFSVTLGAAS